MARMLSSLLILQDLQRFIFSVMIIFLLSSMSASASAASMSSTHTTSNSSISRQGCQDKCGRVSIPYPFGMGSPNCYHDKAFEITCTSQIPFIKLSPASAQVVELTMDYIRFMGWSLPNCYNKESGKSEGSINPSLIWQRIHPSLSQVIPVVTVVAKQIQAIVVDKEFTGDIHGKINPNGTTVPMMLDWVIENVSCETAQRTSYACGENSVCMEFINGPGYRCNCEKGYTGNPYLGCQGYHGDGRALGVGCTRDSVIMVASLGVGIVILAMVLIAIGFWLYNRVAKRKYRHLKRNGGLLLKQKITFNGGNIENASKIFRTDELKKATDNFNPNRIIGKGGFGTVYKEMLSNGRIVAIKKSKLVDENQVAQFINEVVILSQTNHRHIVKLLGCCLETEVPLLVYEFVSNGTLSYHLHGGDSNESSISWKDRLRIAWEIAGALAYLHSDASTPILHRDIKPDNILLDENYKATVSDFGISRSISMDKTHLTTMVQGTLGYLDPESYNSGQFTEKSDVYSFGVLLVELLTGQKAISLMRTEQNLAFHFLSSMNQNQLFSILEDQVVSEGDKDEIFCIANLIKKCLKLNINERPIMKEVASSLDGLIKFRGEQNCHQHPTSTISAFDVQGFETGSYIFSGNSTDFESANSIFSAM
ncbi:wall-associated receptor kinase-like 5 [Papaver somniferum]|uniref:wall-associated receptor kinase-like 5 n=1 Tax=Papaver somniferum TaxID=3469 RepID=UPI000E6F5BFB|nr:wall-associated receptor kinase-like 5 [Papaver somniferum]